MSCKQAEAGTPHAKRPVVAEGLCATCQRARKRRRRVRGRVSAVLRAFGWTEEETAALRRFQRGRCAICPRKVGVVKNAAMDHDHAKERAGWPIRLTVRGQLCSTCNRYLGHIGDDPEVAIRMALYLIDPPAPKVLTDLDRQGKLGTSASEGYRSARNAQ